MRENREIIIIKSSVYLLCGVVLFLTLFQGHVSQLSLRFKYRMGGCHVSPDSRAKEGSKLATKAKRKEELRA